MPEVTYRGEQPVWTPTLAAEGNTELGVWEPGQTKDVPSELIEGLCAEGSAFSTSADGEGSAAPPEEAPAEAETEQKPAGGLFRRG